MKPLIERFNPVDGEFYLVKRGSNGRMLAKAFSLDDARLIAAVENMQAALLDALPFVTDVLDNSEQLKGFKRGTVEAVARRIRNALNQAEGLS